MKRVPLVPTLLVLAAVAVMVRLGFWQLDRLHQKQAMLARYAAAQSVSADAPFPQDAASIEAALFRHARIDCRPTGTDAPIAGHNAEGAAGWVHVQSCDLPGGGQAAVVLGWSAGPQLVTWAGGQVSGVVAPGARGTARLVADVPLAGLQANARPDPRNIPNNHLSYAVQWFLFAATALVIYALALRKRLAAGDGQG